MRWRGSNEGRLWGDGVHVAAGSSINAPTEIGEYTRINGPASIRGDGAVSIGRYCAIGRGFTVISHNHQTNRANLQLRLDRDLGIDPAIEAKPVTIGNNAWVGDDVTIMPGGVVGDGCVVAARSVVVAAHPVPAFHVSAGVPSRVKRQRFSEEVCDLLHTVAWWDWPRERVLRNSRFFQLDLSSADAEQARAAIVA